MFTKSIVAVFSVLAVASSGVVAKPVAPREAPQELARRTGSSPSFNNYGGFGNMQNFDNFFGQDNFNAIINEQIIIQQTETIVCSSQEIFIVQQRLSVLLEVAKQIIIEQVCEVEVQTIVFEQFSAQFNVFGDSLSRSNGRQISYDSNISGKFGNIYNGNSLSNNDLGFSGSGIGSNSVLVGGNNWNNNSSPSSVGNAKNLAQDAANNTQLQNLKAQSSD